MSKSTRVLTGITTSGIPHLGNYAGAIRPAIEASQQPSNDAFFFMADYHALIKCDDPERVAQSRLAIAATWLAAGLDPERVTFYRQSDIPEIPELNWLLSCMTAKGLMNRAHAYKAAQDHNESRGVELDEGISMGLFSYPVLMAADILMFNAQQVPVGRDQIQHIEMARDIAQRFNHHYGQGKEFFVLPQALIAEHVATLPGLDGRKMSKSYDNTIPLFEGGSAALKQAVMRIVTDSKQPGEAKDPDSTMLTQLYAAFAQPDQLAAFRAALQDGIAWGEAKQQLYQLLENLLAPMREEYERLMQRPQEIEDILQEGARKARAEAQPLMARLREAVGLRSPRQTTSTQGSTQHKAAKARFVSFKEGDWFKFRLLDAQGEELLCSEPFSDPRAAGLAQKHLREQGAQDVQTVEQQAQILIEGRCIAQCPTSRLAAVQAALASL